MATTAGRIVWVAKAILAGVLAIELAGAVALVVPRWNALVAVLARMAAWAAAVALILEGVPNVLGGDPGALGATTVVAGLAVFVARGSAVPRSRRSVAAVAALLACASPARRTPEPSRSVVAAAGVRLAADRQERRLAAPVVDAPLRVLAVDEAARVVVTPSGGAHLVLRVFPEQLPDGVGLNVLYHAGDDAEEPARRGAEIGLASAAQELLDAFGPFADLAHIERVSVTALFGGPGETGAIEQRCFTRDAGQWRACGIRRSAAQVPPVEMKLVRDRDAEAHARRVASEFIFDIDRADYDAAWSRTSALVKATMTRTEFERCLAALRHAAAADDPPLYLSLPATGARFVPGSSIEGWVARALDDGPTVEALTLRLDDDLEWRVASFLELTPSAGSPASTAPPSVASEI